MPLTAKAADSIWIGDPAMAEMRLVSAVDGTGRLENIPLGLEFRMAPGWKVYWRTPGEAGLPPTITLDQNFNKALSARVAWPAPKRFNAFGFDNFGYAEHVVLPISLAGHISGTPLQLTADVEALVCADICVPLAGTLDLDIADGTALPTIHTQMIAEYASAVPRPGSAPTINAQALWHDSENLYVSFAALTTPIEDIFVEGIDGVAFKKPEMNGQTARIAMQGKLPENMIGMPVTLTVVGQPSRAGLGKGDVELAEVRLLIGTAPEAVNSDAKTTASLVTASLALGAILFTAFLGGLILNLMPCVLPVLAIKVTSILSVAGMSAGHVRRRFLASATGILVSFMILAVGLGSLRYAGAQIGWGIQFQNPVFLIVMVLVISLFALIMLDRVTLPIPAFVSRLSAGAGSGYAGDFLAGMLATLLATPCSAPFVGTAVTVALTGDNIMLFGIFAAMGFGLALPWLLLALWPQAVAFLPKPGRWMGTMKYVLALFLGGTVIWLLTIFHTLGGSDATRAVVVILLLGFGLVAFRGFTVRITRLIMSVTVVAAMAVPIIMSPNLPEKPLPEAGLGVDVAWQPWHPKGIDMYLAKGQVIFVDVTADWCITCKVNKRFVINDPAIAARLDTAQQQGKLVMLQADWTRPDRDISRFLAQYGRFGIPFNAIFSPSHPDGIILPELLTTDIVDRNLDLAGLDVN
ncbi:protein-disulfide reductase DsbD family protein [Candidatus Puniceispirillum sp.]|uniref:protein-disulfide reductase DsbD family protein n=1 Tax=Candidatus Puniceispirillum sp. TaxID=2026719 RepID=UPI003F6A20F9